MRIAIIPARGGSKRIPGKNGRPFHGMPLLAYPIRACLKTGLFDHIIVSTDSPELAALARDCGAETPFIRPAELAGDNVPTKPVVEHALAWAQKNWGSVAAYCQLYANPFVSSASIREGYRVLESNEAPEVLAITEFAYSPLRAFTLDERNSVEYRFPEYAAKRSQDLPPLYHDAAQFYWHDPLKYRLASRHFALPVMRPAHLVADIDTEEDWKRAEKLYLAVKNELD